MSIPVIDTLHALGNFPVVNSDEVQCGNYRLDVVLNQSATALAAKYSKPASGIPKTDLASDVQASLGKADTALQSHQSLANYVQTTDSRLTDSRPASDVFAWAKEPTRPRYTASDVGALPSTTVIPSKTSDLTNDSGFITNSDISGKADKTTVSDVSNRVTQNATDIVAVNARVDAIVATPAGSTEGNEELIDIRLGADGRSYSTAGNAVRTQISESKQNLLKNILTMTQDGEMVLNNGRVTQRGMLDVSDGHFYLAVSDTKLGASEDYVPLDTGTTYTVKTSSTKFNLFFYDTEKQYVKALYNPNECKADTYTFTNSNYGYIRIQAYKAAGNIGQDDFNAINVTTVVDNVIGQNAELIPMDFIEFNSTNGTLKFTGTTQVRCGKNALALISANTSFDVSAALSGSFLYYDVDLNKIVLSASRTSRTVLIGAIWANGNIVLFVPDRYVKVNGKVLGNNVWNLMSLTGVNLDINNKTITFGANSYFTDGYKIFSLKTEPYSVDGMTGGSWIYYNYSTDTFTKTKTNDTVLVGALWGNGSIQFSGQSHLANTEGMPVVNCQRFIDKTVNCLGDSMTYGSGTTKAYHQWFKLLIGAKTVNNYGVAGSCISPKKDEYPTWEADIQSFLERYNTMSDADAVVVFGGVNDWVTGRTLGTVNDATNATFYGSMHLLCQGLIEKYPTSRIYFFTSPQNDYVHRKANIPSDSEYYGNIVGKNRKGNTLVQYVDAMIEVCGIYGIPCKDLYRNSWWGLSGVLGIQGGTAGAYGADSLHPNYEGHKVLAVKMASFINGN